MFVRRRWIRVVGFGATLCAFAVLTAGCARLTQAPSGGGGSTTDIAAGETLDASETLEVGETFEIELTANPSTGFGWQVDEIDEDVVRQVGEAVYTADVQEEGIVGAGGVETFTFEAVGAGECEISLVYVRPWEWESSQPVEPESVHSVTVTVQ